MVSDKSFKSLLAAILLALFLVTNFIGPGAYRKVLIDGDGSGLYAYLPTVFVYHTVDFTSVFALEKSRRPPDYMGHNYHPVNGTLINKFTCGTALLELPFFLLAWLLSLLFGMPADGYNLLFQYAVGVSALFWAWIGLLYFVRLAVLYKVNEKYARMMTFAGLLATNLLYQTLIVPAASHVYSFALLAVFLFYMKKAFDANNRKALYIASFMLGLITLVRPVDILIVAALPFLAATPEKLFRILKTKLAGGRIFLIILLFLAGLAPQLLINYLQTGNLLIYGYQNEGFYFTRPEWINFLFSYNKGWFVYTPFMLLLIPGIVALYKRSIYEFYSFLAFLIVLIYVFSSWWNWFYGDSFGMRPMVDFYSLFFLVILLFYTSVQRKWIRIAVSGFIMITLVLNALQTYQYAQGILHPDAMNKEAYWKVFLRTSEKYKGVVAGTDESFYGKLDDEPFFLIFNDMEKKHPGWNKPVKPDKEAFSGEMAARLDSDVEYSPSFVYQIPDSLVGMHNLYVLFETMYLEPQPNAATGALFIVDINDKEGNTLFYKKFRVKKLPDEITEQWRREHIGFKLPELTDDMHRIKFYIWNVSKTNFLVDNMKIEVYTYY